MIYIPNRLQEFWASSPYEIQKNEGTLRNIDLTFILSWHYVNVVGNSAKKRTSSTVKTN